MSVVQLTEQQSGMRLCKTCNKLLPLDSFKSAKRTYMCIMHTRALRRKFILGTQEKRAFNSLRCRARQDMLTFGHKSIAIPRKQVTAMLTEEQLRSYPDYCIIPRRPDVPLTPENAIVVTSCQRRYVVAKWKTTRNADQYEADLAFILGAPK